MPTNKLNPVSCAFVSSSFGFGPVSKAATIAKEIKIKCPQIETHFFGGGIALQFAEQSKAFDYLFEADVDETNKLEYILPRLKKYKTVFSVLNLPLLPLWNENFGRLFFVDSLAWLWKEPPDGIENVETYFVQDYLISTERIREWKNLYPINLIPPIGLMLSDNLPIQNSGIRQNRLLINFSGCSNQFVKTQIYEKYVITLLSLILENSANNYKKIEVCVNRKIAEKLNKLFKSDSLIIGQLSHEEFINKLSDSRLLLTAPGITTTLEALSLNTPLGFLLPQNDSQAMMSELYRRQIDESQTMAFSRFDEKLAFPTTLEEFESLKQPIELAVQRMNFILETHQEKIKQFVIEMLNKPSTDYHLRLKSNIRQKWNKTGQAVIVEKVFNPE